MRIGQTPEQSQPVPSIFHRIRTELYKKYGNEAILNVFRACSFPTGLSASTNQAGENMDRASSIDFLTFCTVLKDLGIFMTDQEVTQLDYADISRDGCLSSYELMALLRGDFDHPGRRRVVYQAWERLDPKRTGAVDVAKLENCFSAQRHPMVNEKKKTEQDVFEEFMSQLTPHSQNGKEKVTREEFWTYYGGVSAGIIDDATFECLVRNTWNMASANEKLFLRNEELYNSLLKNYKTASSYGLTTEQKEAQSLTPAFSQKNVLLDSKLNDVPRASYFSLLQRPAAPGASNPYLTTYQRYGSLPQEKCCTPPIIHRRAHPTTGTENAELQLTLQGLLSTKAKLDAEIAEEESKNSKEVEDATQRTHDKRNMVAELRPEVMKTYFDGREEEIKIDQHRRNLLQTPLQSSSAERSIRWNTTYRTYHTHLLPAVDRTARETALYVESTLRPPSREPMWKDPAARKAIADRVRARGKQTVGYAEPHGVTQASTWIAGTLQTTTQASRYLLPALQDPSESETQYLQDLEKRSQQRVHATHGDGHELQVAIARNTLETHKYDRKALMVRSGDPLYKTQSRSLKWWDGDRQPNRYVTTYRLNTVSNYPRNELMPLSQS